MSTVTIRDVEPAEALALRELLDDRAREIRTILAFTAADTPQRAAKVRWTQRQREHTALAAKIMQALAEAGL